jgi:serine/threonine protein kinase
MPWPTPQDYNEAIQNPRASFDDPELRAGKPELTRLGLPRPITGNFASVYRMRCSGRDWAVRCFFREYTDMGERYAAISRHLAAARLQYTVGFEYLERGIKVRGTWYPILKMEWVEGELLNTFIARNLDNPARLKELADRWLQMLDALRRASVAHGDLQHGNVLVVGESLKLVDYDGMFVPPLAGRTSHEIGHPNYQHPARSGRHFTPAVDRFSAGVVYLSLLGVAAQRDLWDRLGGGDECLLFRKTDFDSPAQSDAFSLLAGLSEPRARTVTAQALKNSAAAPWITALRA